MSALTFLATALTTMLIVSAIVCLAIYGPEEEKNFIQGTFEVFWLIAHVAVIVALAIFYIAALLWGISI